ncbi:MAG: hypothetical protein ACRERV_04685 [Methylococcales bacterium]
MITILLVFFVGLLIATLGVYMVYLGNAGNTEFTFFGQTFKSMNVGIAAIFIGAAMIVLVSGRVLKTIDKTVVAETSISQKESQVIPKDSQDSFNQSARIVIRLSDDLRKLNLDFSLLHVRDGKDEVTDKGPLLNEEISFKEIDRLGNLEATVRFSKHLGFQFKCFVDYRPYEFDEVKRLLEDNEFLDIRKGDGKPFRIWFILPGYITYETVDGIVNNFYYPS